jgi:arginine utilization protein RocB
VRFNIQDGGVRHGCEKKENGTKKNQRKKGENTNNKHNKQKRGTHNTHPHSTTEIYEMTHQTTLSPPSVLLFFLPPPPPHTQLTSNTDKQTSRHKADIPSPFSSSSNHDTKTPPSALQHLKTAIGLF